MRPEAVAFKLRLVETLPAQLLSNARLEAGLSARGLAAKADVPTSTITRIERGTTDPTLGMLTRLLDATGHELLVTARIRGTAPPTIAALTSAVDAGDGRLRVDWTRLRAFADWARRHPDEVATALADPPRRTDTPLDAILAGMAELLAERCGITPPTWIRSVPTPREEWAPPGTPAMHARAREACPEAFSRRNILLPEDTIFRDAA